MFYIVSKFLTFFIMPLGIIFLILTYAFYTKNRTKSKRAIGITLFFLYLFTCPMFVNAFLLNWEIPPIPISSVAPHDIGIILTGGITNDDKLPKENVFLGKTSDRVGQAIQLYKNGKIKKILVSGGSIEILGETPKKEVEEVAKYLIISGIPSQNIFLETHARNTRENAVNCSKILKKGSNGMKNQKYLLITSGFHLKRAMKCFEKVGIKVMPYGSNYLSHEQQLTLASFIPKEDYLSYSNLLFREIIGYYTYKILGWI